MIYSRWNGSGKFDYFEAPGEHPIGSDLPKPNHVDMSSIGTPIQNVGRILPSDARKIGSGDQPIGLMAKAKKSKGIAGTSSSDSTYGILLVASLILGIAVIGVSIPEVRK